MLHLFTKTVWQFHTNTNTHVPYEPVFPPIGFYSRQMTDMSMEIFVYISSLFIISKKNVNSQNVHQQINE